MGAKEVPLIIAKPRSSYKAPLALLTSLFFIWGFITCLNDILIPHLKAVFDLNYTRVMLIQFCFFGAYFVMSIPSSWIIGKIGYKRGIVLGLFVTGIGSLLFIPASRYLSYNTFLLALFILASGITILQVSANPYVAVLGDPETASSRLNFTQALNSLGTTVAPLFGAFLILSNSSASIIEKAKAVQVPYLEITSVLFLMAIVFAFVKLPALECPPADARKHASAWKYSHLVLGAIAIFVYVGGEVTIGSLLISYISQPEIGGITAFQASRYVSLYWGGAMVGRFIGAALLQKIKPSRLLAINAIAVLVLLAVTLTSKGNLAVYSVISIGLFNSIMFPTIFTLAIAGLGHSTSQGSGILCMAIVGGAVVPVLAGHIADVMGIQMGFLVPLLCYAYIVFYGVKGYCPKKIGACK
jgi:FHS family L-fucose permease-like MFS transporter